MAKTAFFVAIIYYFFKHLKGSKGWLTLPHKNYFIMTNSHRSATWQLFFLVPTLQEAFCYDSIY